MSPRVVWRFSDGKAGHDNQSRGLVEALQRLQPLEVADLPPLSAGSALTALLGGWPAWRALPSPDLIVGAGHRTHLSLLAARGQHGGRIVVLMRPSLPLSWFDLCLIPEHDSPPTRPNVLTTRGALNRIQPAVALKPDRGLLLIGGPSAHFGWDEASLQQQINTLLAATPTIQWTLTTSRRTPATFLETLQHPSTAPLVVVPVVETGPDWLPAQLASAAQVWVTADSVSMVYEALTAGAAVGILATPLQKPNRISQGLEQLAAQGWVTPFANGSATAPLARPPGVFAEADRCARWIVERWLS